MTLRRRFILRLLIQTAAIGVVAQLLPGIAISGPLPAAVAALLLSLVNLLVKPLLIVLTLPITLVSLGVFLLFINGFCFWLVSALVPGFEIHGVFSAVFGAVLVTILTWVLQALLDPPHDSSGPQDHRPHGVKFVKSEIIH